MVFSSENTLRIGMRLLHLPALVNTFFKAKFKQGMACLQALEINAIQKIILIKLR